MATRHDVENDLLHALQAQWRALNQIDFHQELRPPVLVLGEGASSSWQPRERTLTMGLDLLLSQQWNVVTEVLRHEMAHQFVDEVLGQRGETAHGPAFRYVCQSKAIDPAASGAPRAPSQPEGRTLRRIRRLLALAESPEIHEAEAAMNAAHRLMRKHNIRALHDARPAFASRLLGPIRKRTPTTEKLLGGLLTRHFFVEGVRVMAYDVQAHRWGRVLEITGTPDNLEMAAWVYEFMLQNTARLWEEHKRRHDIRGNRERLRFMAGAISGFYQKLDEAQRSCESEGLVWLGDPRLEEHFNRRHPRLVAGRGSTIQATDAWHHGRAAGRKIVLNRPVGADSQGRGRLLE